MFELYFLRGHWNERNAFLLGGRARFVFAEVRLFSLVDLIEVEFDVGVHAGQRAKDRVRAFENISSSRHTQHAAPHGTAEGSRA